MNILKNFAFASKSLRPSSRGHSVFLPKFRFATNYNSQGFLRIHGRLRYDENMNIKNDEDIQEVFFL